jgi:hypothetical protein
LANGNPVPATMPDNDVELKAVWKAHAIYGPFYTSNGNPFKIAIFTE